MSDLGTGILTQIYTCRKCGDIWKVYIAEEVDIDNDEVHQFATCSQCGSEVDEKIVNGIPCMHDITQEEMYWLQQLEEE